MDNVRSRRHELRENPHAPVCNEGRSTGKGIADSRFLKSVRPATAKQLQKRHPAQQAMWVLISLLESREDVQLPRDNLAYEGSHLDVCVGGRHCLCSGRTLGRSFPPRIPYHGVLRQAIFISPPSRRDSRGIQGLDLRIHHRWTCCMFCGSCWGPVARQPYVQVPFDISPTGCGGSAWVAAGKRASVGHGVGALDLKSERAAEPERKFCRCFPARYSHRDNLRVSSILVFS
jgi:hypothetical protein